MITVAPTIGSQYRNSFQTDFLTTATLMDYLSIKFVESFGAQYNISTLHNYASKDVDTFSPGITYRISRRTPGHNKIDNFKASLKRTFLDSNTGEVFHLWTQYQTVSYEFVIYGLDFRQVDELTEAFESLLFMLQPELQQQNVQHFLFEEELREDLAPLSKKLEIQYKRVLRYTATLQKPFVLNQPTIARITLAPGVSSELIKDIPVFRSQDQHYDVLEQQIDWTVSALNSISLQPMQDLLTWAREVESATGLIQANKVVSDSVFLPDIDYKFVKERDSYGINKYYIFWSTEERSKRPLPNQIYYISWYQPIHTPTKVVEV